MFATQQGSAALPVSNYTLSIIESGPGLGPRSDAGQTYLHTEPKGAWTFNGLHLGTMFRDYEVSTVTAHASPSEPDAPPADYQVQLTDWWPLYSGPLWVATNDERVPLFVVPPAWYSIRVSVRSRRKHSKDYGVTGESWLVQMWPVADLDETEPRP